ncbi:hypothetical protein HP550_07185 [Cellulomonas humilata]|uniref:YCII-related domain-containing protein n=1 Tax=Cellulomonas humilata TaxID=144055 RepID=A0A7Y5ZZR6_9CELL|nr:YciI family protein [Cellulomonas humilata]NUU17030.1 hypothetical protein [Cellulomonas humilata]
MAMFVLLHVRGPAVPDGQTVGEQAGIAGHYDFLRRRRGAGQLVLAGPFLDTEGAGMTILEVESAEEAQRLAAHDDQAVVDGVLAVTVRPWRVVMSGS